MIRLEGVSFSYGTVRALDSVDLALDSGVAGLVGPNGAGKSTLIRLILGLTSPEAGRVAVMGADPVTSAAVRSHIGFASEDDSLPEDSRPVDAVRLMARLNGIRGAEAVRRAGEILDLVGVDDERLREYRTLSTGQKQRVKIAMSLVCSPKLVVLDEPTNGLDPIQRDSMLTLIRRMSDEFGIVVLFATHLIEEVRRIADVSVNISGGKITAVNRVSGSDSNVLRLECQADTAGLVTRLRSHGHKIKSRGRTVLVSPGSDSVYEDIRDAAVATSTPIRRLEPHLPGAAL